MGSCTRLSRSTIVPPDPRCHSSAFNDIIMDNSSGRVAECPASTRCRDEMPVLCQQVSDRCFPQRSGSCSQCHNVLRERS